MHTFTGAAQTWLVVNNPATRAIASDTTSAKSFFRPLLEPFPVPIRLISQKTPAARNPRGAVMEPGISVNLVFEFISFQFGAELSRENQRVQSLFTEIESAAGAEGLI